MVRIWYIHVIEVVQCCLPVLYSAYVVRFIHSEGLVHTYDRGREVLLAWITPYVRSGGLFMVRVWCIHMIEMVKHDCSPAWRCITGEVWLHMEAVR